MMAQVDKLYVGVEELQLEVCTEELQIKDLCVEVRQPHLHDH